MNESMIENHIFSLCDDFFAGVESDMHCDSCDYFIRKQLNRGMSEYRCGKREDGEFCPEVVRMIENAIEANR